MNIYSNSFMYSDGSWLLDRSGNLIPVKLHVPSTTWIGRNLDYLAPTDAEFLLDEGLITEEEAWSILMYNFLQFIGDNEEWSIMDVTKFNQYAELRYAPTLRMKLMVTQMEKTKEAVEDCCSDFNQINNVWYNYLKNMYVKVSKFGRQLEFRISSTDGHDWNKEIIDDVLLKHNAEGLNISIIKELPNNKCKMYFSNASLHDILDNDKLVLSSKIVTRKVLAGKIVYV